MFSPKDRETRKPRGFTFCQYRRKEDAEDAVKGMDKRVGSLFLDNNLTCYSLVSINVSLSPVSSLCLYVALCFSLSCVNEWWVESRLTVFLSPGSIVAC